MKNFVGFVLLLCSCSVFAAGVGVDVWHTYDTDDLKLNRVTATNWFDKDASGTKHGVSLTRKMYTSPQIDANMNAVTYSADTKVDDYTLIGHAGVGQIHSKQFLFGDIELQKRLNKYVTVSAGFYGDVVDSVVGLDEGITVNGIVVGGEVSNEYGGVAGNVRQAYYTNGNTQTGWFLKPYVNVFEGVNVYVSTRQYTNSDPYNGDFFAPEDFERYNFGVGFRQRIYGWVVSGFVEQGKAYIDGAKEDVEAWRFKAERPLADKWTGSVMAGEDVSANRNYIYNYFNISIRYDF